jgi:ribosomal protein S18 acetylase RimI-like enzyme
MRIEQTRAPASVDAAAQIWAEATAARDGEDEVADLADSRPIIQGVLDRSPDSMLLLARSEHGIPLAFAAVEPVRDQGHRVAELSYFGVNPHLFGQGVGKELLRELRRRLKARGYQRAELSVYVDNIRAVRLYERLGWQARGEPTPHPRTGKPEQRYQLSL